MSYKVNKIIYLLLGLVLGFFVGGGIIWWQLQKENPFAKSDKYAPNEKIYKENHIKASKLDFKTKYKSQLKKYKIPDTFIDSLKMDSTTLTLEQLIELYSKEEHIDTNHSSSDQYNENIVISKDELLFSKVMEIKGNYQTNDSYELDSILTDQRNTSRKAKNKMKVEFWRSPINYRGYKFDDTKLVLFGLLEFEDIMLLGEDNQLFVKYSNDFYRIENTDDFKSLIPIKDASLLKALRSL